MESIYDIAHLFFIIYLILLGKGVAYRFCVLERSKQVSIFRFHRFPIIICSNQMSSLLQFLQYNYKQKTE